MKFGAVNLYESIRVFKTYAQDTHYPIEVIFAL